jgi:hypothetical protein
MPKLEFKEREDDPYLYDIIEDDGTVIDQFNDEANSDYPEDLTMRRMIGDIYQTAYDAGYARAKRENLQG